MIAWKTLEQTWDKRAQEAWRRRMCDAAIKSDGSCMGFSQYGDDEPCDVCKACDRMGVEVDNAE